MTGTGAVDGVGIDGTDSGQYINYMTRSNFDETFPKTPVKSRLLPKRMQLLICIHRNSR